MKQVQVHCFDEAPPRHSSYRSPERSLGFVTVQRKLLLAWCVVGLVPLVLQIRSFLKFVAPHKIAESLVAPTDTETLTANMTELCPALRLQMSEVWWNFESTHHYNVKHGRLCHAVSPQYNCHGNYWIGPEKTTPYHSVPVSCANDSYPVHLYFYHGTIGFYSFYEEATGTYCTKDHTIYGAIDGLGTFDINGWLLAKDTGSYGYRWSGWYATVGTVLIIYRSFAIRRRYVACKRYGRKCDQLGEELDRNTIMVFVHENMRLSAHCATNYHRVGLLYLLIEGIMSDIFLLVATEGMSSWLQYISLGYNLSGVVLLLFEMVENMGWLRESTRLAIKRLLFSYESSLVGELLSAIAQSHFLTSLSHSDLKNSGSVARAVSYYVWGLVGHASIVLPLIGSIMFVRVVRAVTYMRWKHGVWWSIFTAPCCVDTTLGMLNKMKMLGGYEWKGGKLYYTPHALKAFGLLKMEEKDGTEFVVLRKLHWWKIPANDLVVIGVVTGQLVEPCIERPCLGMVSFLDRSLGGPLVETGRQRPRLIHGRSRIMPRQALMNVFPAS